LGDLMRVNLPAQRASAIALGDGDLYSPWSVADGFRIGGR